MKTLTPGSKCVIYAVSSNEDVHRTSGIFQGYVPLGEDTSLCIELDDSHGDMKGKLRLIPISSIAAVDIIELADDQEEEKEEEKIYYS